MFSWLAASSESGHVTTEADTCRTHVLPALYGAGWKDEQIAEQLPHRRLSQQTRRLTMGIAVDLPPLGVRRVATDTGQGQRGRVGDTKMSTGAGEEGRTATASRHP
jgi:hypothetical protein